MAVGSNPGKTFFLVLVSSVFFHGDALNYFEFQVSSTFYVSCKCNETLLNRMGKLVYPHSSRLQIIFYFWLFEIKECILGT